MPYTLVGFAVFFTSKKRHVTVLRAYNYWIQNYAKRHKPQRT
jgi:hypothetical protein